MKLPVKLVHPEARAPVRASAGAAGYDVYACETVEIDPRSRALVSLGLSMAIPDGYYGRLAPRSGLAYKLHVDVAAGVIDSKSQMDQ